MPGLGYESGHYYFYAAAFHIFNGVSDIGLDYVYDFKRKF